MLLTFYVSIIISTILIEKNCNTLLAISLKGVCPQILSCQIVINIQTAVLPHSMFCLLYDMKK